MKDFKESMKIEVKEIIITQANTSITGMKQEMGSMKQEMALVS